MSRVWALVAFVCTVCSPGFQTAKQQTRRGVSPKPIAASAQARKRTLYVVPDAQSAEEVAAAVLGPLLGRKEVSEMQPFTAQLKGDYWLVPTGDKFPLEVKFIETYFVRIRRVDCRIDRIYPAGPND